MNDDISSPATAEASVSNDCPGGEGVRESVPAQANESTAAEARGAPGGATMSGAPDDKSFNEKIKAEISEINSLDASVRGVSDLLGMKNYEEFKSAVGRGLSFAEAFKLVNFGRLMKSVTEKAEKEREEAEKKYRAMLGKSHLTPTVTRGNPVPEVPAQVADYYRSFYPGITDSEIRRSYAKYISRG